MSESFRGQVEHIIYKNDRSNWTVARLSLADNTDSIVIVGTIPLPYPGELLEVTGEWTKHPKFGIQFAVESSKTIPPSSLRGIEKFLSSGLKGIGDEMAKRLVSEFGKDTLDVIENDINRLQTVAGIGKKRIRMISDSWNKHRGRHELLVFLQSNNIGLGLAEKIQQKYGDLALEIIRANPYTLASDIFGIGFLTADRLALNMGFERESVLRAEGGLTFVLQRLSDNGHVCSPESALIDKTCKLLDVSESIVTRGMRGLRDRGRIVCEKLENEIYCYLRPLYLAEKGVAKHLINLDKDKRHRSAVDWNRSLGWVEKRLNLTLSTEQKNAIKGALENKVCIITGGPGTGKTTIIRGIVELMNRRGSTVLLAAPTGRAAKRLSETTEREAKTIHRLLEFNPQDGKFKRNLDHPLSTDVLVIDETSMIDVSLMHHLLKALPSDAGLVLVGDVNQLPSVGPGSILRDIIESETVIVARLTQIYRQAGKSLITVNAHRINQGLFPLMENPDSKDLPDFYFVEQDNPDHVLQLIIKLCTERIRDRFGFDPFNEVQVITPMNKGVTGVINLNRQLQASLNPSAEDLPMGDRVLRVGDKVMQIRNNYDKDVFNGDIGLVLSIDRNGKSINVDYDSRMNTVLVFRSRRTHPGLRDKRAQISRE